MDRKTIIHLARAAVVLAAASAGGLALYFVGYRQGIQDVQVAIPHTPAAPQGEMEMTGTLTRSAVISLAPLAPNPAAAPAAPAPDALRADDPTFGLFVWWILPWVTG